MGKLRRAFVASVVIGGVAAMMGGPASAEETVTLKISHTWPATSAQHQHIEAWVKHLEEQSGGALTARIFPGGALLNARQDWDGLKSGLADVVMGMRLSPAGRPIGSALTGLSSGIRTAKAGQEAAYAVLEAFPQFAQEWEANELLWLAAHGPAQIHTNKEIRSLEDLSGLQLRTAPSKSVVGMVEALGAVPVSMPMPSSFTALQKGTVDGIIAPWETLDTFKLGDVTTNTTIADLYASPSFYVAMNKQAYGNLPAELKQVIDQSKAWGRAQSAQMWSGVDEMAMTKVDPARAAASYQLSKEERDRWTALMEPVRVQIAEDLESQGLPGQQIKQLVDSHIAAQSDDQ